MVIIVDTREQLPYWTTNRKTLLVGDYTTRVLHNHFHIERKSLQDLYGTIIQGNRRFKYELFRAAYNQIKIAVYVEGCYTDFIAKKFPKGSERKCTSEKLAKIIRAFELKYHVEFVWLSCRAHCIDAVRTRLQREEKALSPALVFKRTGKALKSR